MNLRQIKLFFRFNDFSMLNETSRLCLSITFSSFVEVDFTILFPSFQYWLDVDKQMCHQVGLSSLCFNSPSTSLQEPLLRFCVKFYTPDPAQIEEEYTRYLFSLQIKRDLATGLLQCNDNTAALMASYIVQCKY